MTTDNPEGAAPSAQQPGFRGSACAPAVGDAAGWDERCVLGHCGSPSGCERDNLCRANLGSQSGPQVEQQPPVAPDEVTTELAAILTALCDNSDKKLATGEYSHRKPPMEALYQRARAALRSLRPLSVHQATPPAVDAQARSQIEESASSQAEQKLTHRLSLSLNEDEVALLLEMLGGERAPITLRTGDGHSGWGLYAWFTEYPEEGAVFLGEEDADESARQGAALTQPEARPSAADPASSQAAPRLEDRA